MLLRPHAKLVANEQKVFKAFEKSCITRWIPEKKCALAVLATAQSYCPLRVLKANADVAPHPACMSARVTANMSSVILLAELVRVPFRVEPTLDRCSHHPRLSVH